MENDEIKPIVDHMVKVAKGTVERGEEVLPVVFLLRPNGELYVCGCVHSSDREKRNVFAQVSRHAREVKAIVAIVMTDAWYMKLPTDWKGPIPKPSEHPELRKEALHLTAVTPDGKVVWFGSHPYHREGQQIVWDEPMIQEGEKVECEQNLLPPWAPEGGRVRRELA